MTRLPEWDYTRQASYFVTLCTANREPRFGDIVDGVMHLSVEGEIVEQEWWRTGSIRSNITIDVFITMPDHLHGIVTMSPLNNLGKGEAITATRTGLCPHGARSGSLGVIIGQFQSASTKGINQQLDTDGSVIWQRNYHEHIIRDHHDFLRIRRYIAMNPSHWHEDDENPALHQ